MNAWAHLLLIFLLSRCVCSHVYQTLTKVDSRLDLFVSPDGRDEWSGRFPDPSPNGQDGPLRTVSAAQALVRQLLQFGKLEGVTELAVNLRYGSYNLDKTLSFGPKDSSPDLRISYVTYQPDRQQGMATITGGRALTEADGTWEKVDDAKNLWVVRLKEKMDFNQLFVDDSRALRARHPNPGHFLTMKDSLAPPRQRWGFVFEKGDISSEWHDLGQVELIIYGSWSTARRCISTINQINHTVTFTYPTLNAPMGFGPNSGSRYFVENIKEGLDMAGEWYLDRSPAVNEGDSNQASIRSALYYVAPSSSWHPKDHRFVLPVIKGDMIEIKGSHPTSTATANASLVHNLRFEYIDFRRSDWTKDCGFSVDVHYDFQAASFLDYSTIHTQYAHGIEIVDCRLSQVGSYGVWFDSGTRHSVVHRLNTSDTGAGAVRVGRGKPLKDETGIKQREIMWMRRWKGESRIGGEAEVEASQWTSGYNTVSDCVLEDGGRVFREAVAVLIQKSSYNRVAYNRIAHHDYSGVSVGWVWGYDADKGAMSHVNDSTNCIVKTGGDEDHSIQVYQSSHYCTTEGASSAHHNIIEFNEIFDVGRGELSDLAGIYLLGVSPGTIVRSNKIYDVAAYFEFAHGLYADEGASCILFENNMAFRTTAGVWYQHFGLDNIVRNNIFAYSTGTFGTIWHHAPGIMSNFTFERNVVALTQGTLLGSTYKGSSSTLFRSNAYYNSTAPYLISACFPPGNLTFEEWQESGQDQYSVIDVDPRFVNANMHDDSSRLNFTLADDSPLINTNFVNFNLDDCGPRHQKKWRNAASAAAELE